MNQNEQLTSNTKLDDLAVAEVEQAPEQSLIHVQAFHFPKVHLDRIAPYPAALGDDPTIGEDELGGRAPNRSDEDDREANQSR